MSGENSIPPENYKNLSLHMRSPIGEVNETTPSRQRLPFPLLGGAMMTYAEIAEADLN